MEFKRPILINDLTELVIGLCIKIHSRIGPGCFEKVYEEILYLENRLVIELKSVHPLPPVYFNQVQTQLSLLNLKHGMLVNFKVPKMKEGIHRVYNNFGKEEL